MTSTADELRGCIASLKRLTEKCRNLYPTGIAKTPKEINAHFNKIHEMRSLIQKGESILRMVNHADNHLKDFHKTGNLTRQRHAETVMISFEKKASTFMSHVTIMTLSLGEPYV